MKITTNHHTITTNHHTITTNHHIKKLLLLIIIISTIFYLEVNFASASAFNNFYVVDAEPDVDNSPNIGSSGATDYTDAQDLDGTYEDLTEGLEDYTDNTTRNFFTGGRTNNANLGSNVKWANRWNIAETVSVHTISIYLETYAGGVEIRGGLYNSSGTGNQENPTDLIAETDSIILAQDVGVWKYVNVTFSSPVELNAYQYWVTFHTNDSIRIKRSGFLLMGAYTRYQAHDAFSDGLENPFGSYSGRDGGGYRSKVYYEHTVQSYQLDWEYQANNIATNWDYYKICVYGYVSTAEEFAIKVWDWNGQGGGTPLSWEDWGVSIYTEYWQISSLTPQWHNYSLYQNIYENITWKFTDSYEDSPTEFGDSTQTTLHIDKAGVYGYNYSMDIVEDQCIVSDSIHPADQFVPIDTNSITMNISAGDTFDVRGKGNIIFGGTDSSIYASNSSDTANAVALMVWGVGTVIYTEENATEGTLLPIWIFIKVPTPSIFGDYDGNYSTSLTFYAGGKSDTIVCNFTIEQVANTEPVFTSWSNSTIDNSPFSDIELFGIVYDPDNSSDELSIHIWYSNDSFVSDNRSLIMIYQNSPSLFHYNFSYTWNGESNISYEFYYQANDSINFTEKYNPTVGLYFEISWLSPFAPVIVSWFDSTLLIDPYANVLFDCTVYDTDSNGTQLNVTIFYSIDGFALDNRSVNMSFATQVSPDHYRFTYLWAGEAAGVFYQYYYQANDSTYSVQKPANYNSGILFDIQWDLIIVDGGGDFIGAWIPIIQELVQEDDRWMYWLLLLLLALSSFAVIKRSKKRRYY